MQTKPTAGVAALLIAGSILALLSGGYQIWRGLEFVDILPKYSNELHILRYVIISLGFPVLWLILEAGLAIGAAILFLLGTIYMLAQKAAGRWFVAIGCVVTIEHTAIGYASTITMRHWAIYYMTEEFNSIWFKAPNVPAIVLLSCVVPAITAILVWLPATRIGSPGWPWAKLREGLRPPLGTAQCDPSGELANPTNPTS